MRADCDSLPSGARVRLVSGSHLETGGGNIPLPNGQDLIYPRLAPDGVRLVGIGNADDLAWVWDGSTWNSDGLAFGPRAVIFDADGHLHVIRPAGPAVGYRYVADDGRLVTANETIFDPVKVIWEYTSLGGLTIGQGGDGLDGEDPCLAVFDDGRRRLIAQGRCRFINIHWDPALDLYSIALVREDLNSSEFFWLTRAQIEALSPPTTAPKPERPTCTITSYPSRVVLGDPCIVEASYGGGSITEARWLYRSLGETLWVLAHEGPPEPSCDYGPSFENWGTYELALMVEGPGGSDETVSQRLVQVEEKQEPHPMRLQLAYGPNIGSVDIPRLFTEPHLWTFGHERISAFHLYSQNILNLPPQIGGNTYEAMRDAGLFRLLKDWGVALEMETGSGPDEAHRAAQLVEEAGGSLDVLAFDHAFIEIPAEDFAAWVRQLREERLWVIGAYVVFPSVSIKDILARVETWNRLGARVDFLRMDVDPNPTEERKYTSAVHSQMRDLCDDFSNDDHKMTLQYVVNARDRLSETDYCQQAWDKFQRFEAIGRWDARIVQSWAIQQGGSDNAPKTLPHNLPEGDPGAFTTLLRRIAEALS